MPELQPVGNHDRVHRLVNPLHWKWREGRPNLAAFTDWPLSVFVEAWLPGTPDELHSGRYRSWGRLSVLTGDIRHTVAHDGTRPFDVVWDGQAHGDLARFSSAHATIVGLSTESGSKNIRACFAASGRVDCPPRSDAP
jgi:tellurite resistance-related uncharacterized protein